MPLQNNPPRQIGTSIQRSQNDQYAVERGAGAFNGITEETITATNSDGSYGVANTWLTTSGVSQPINVGDIVKVGWHGGKPVVILSHTARRAKFVPPPPVGGPIVEMLLAAPTAAFAVNQSTDSLDIYFRNASQITLLNCRTQIADAGFVIAVTSLALVPNAWSLDHRHFLVSFINQTNNHPCIAIFHLTGNSTTPISGAAQAKLDQIVDLTTLNIPLGSMSWDQNVLGGAHTLTNLTLGTAIFPGYSVIALSTEVQRASATIMNVAYTQDKHLILAVNLFIGNLEAGGGGANVPFFYPYLIDATAGTVLFNGIAQQGLWPTTIYNGAAFVSEGAGLFDSTGTGTNAWTGGAQFYVIPSKGGNTSRVFIGLRAFYFGGNPSLAGLVQQAVFVRDVSRGLAVTLFPLTTFPQFDPVHGGLERSHWWLMSFDHRYVMWSRAFPGSGNSAIAFQTPLSATLAGYSFNEGIHITDLGVDESVLSATDFIPLTSLSDIESFLDQVPYLTSTALMWEDHNDLRTPVDPNTSVPTGRIAPEFVNFRSVSSSGPVVTTPFVLPLTRFSSIRQAVATLKAIPLNKNYITDMVNLQYLNSGHADMVVGYASFASPNGAFSQIQVISGPGTVLPGQ